MAKFTTQKRTAAGKARTLQRREVRRAKLGNRYAR